MPFNGRMRVTSGFGWRLLNGTQDYHNGVDLVGEEDTTIVSPLDGTVILAMYGKECGNQVQIYTNSGKTMFFCHMSKLYVKYGDIVNRGRPVGVMGATGTKCFGAHLHFGLYRGKGRTGKLLNAQKFLGV